MGAPFQPCVPCVDSSLDAQLPRSKTMPIIAQSKKGPIPLISQGSSGAALGVFVGLCV